MSMKMRFAVALAGTSCLTAVPAFAQSQPATPAPTTSSDADASAQDDIIVRATRRSEVLLDVPMSVDVATGQKLQSLNLFDAKDITQLSPGLELTNSNGRNNTTSLRGVSFDPDQGTSPAVQVYLNEVPVDAQTAYTAIYDIGQIEVLRGAQGTLRGLSSPAGAITISTRRPSFDRVEGYVQAAGTDKAGYDFQGGVSLPFSDKLALRVAALVDGNRINDVRNVTRGDRSQSRTESARATLGWRPTPDFTAYLTYQYLTADNTQYQQVFGPGNVPSALFGDTARSGPAIALGDRLAVLEGPMRFRNDTHIVNLTADWNLGPATLSFVGAHQYSLLKQARDTDVANAIPGYTQTQIGTIPYKVDTAELRLSTNGDGVFNGSIGAFYSKQTGTTVIDQPADSFFYPGPIAFGPYLPIATHITVPVDSQTVSLNATGRLHFGQITIEGGIRYSILRTIQTADIQVASPGYAPFGIAPFTSDQPGIPAGLQRSMNKPLTGGASISWKPSADINLYASYAHSFRAGTSGIGVPVGISNDLIRANPEKTDSYEVGFKAAFLNRKLNLNAAAFYQKYDGFLSRFTGIQYNCPDFFGSCNLFGPPINNATDNPPTNGAFDFNYNGNATVKGVEATLEGRPIENWDFSISASYAHGRYDHARLPCNDYNGDGKPDSVGTPRITGTGNVSYCISNGRIAEIPDFSLSANSEVRFPVGRVTPFIRGLVSYRPGFNSELANYTYASRTTLNAYVGVRGQDNRWEINVFARNLLNQQRITAISQSNVITATSTPGLVYDSGYRTVSLMNPREFGLTASFKW